MTKAQLLLAAALAASSLSAQTLAPPHPWAGAARPPS